MRAAVLRAYGTTSEFTLATLSGAPATIDLYPNGTSSLPLSITLGVPGFTRHVTMTRAGMVRVIP